MRRTTSSAEFSTRRSPAKAPTWVTCSKISRRSTADVRRSRSALAAPDDLQTPGSPALEELVRVDLVEPAEEVPVGLRVGRAVHRRSLHRLFLGVAALGSLE